MHNRNDEEYMCPFCVTPWKCNGPHIDPEDLQSFYSYITTVREETIAELNTPHGASAWHTGYAVGYKEGFEEGKNHKRKEHDPLCNIYEKTCCPWLSYECECQCNCDFIEEVRSDERQRLYD